MRYNLEKTRSGMVGLLSLHVNVGSVFFPPGRVSSLALGPQIPCITLVASLKRPKLLDSMEVDFFTLRN